VKSGRYSDVKASNVEEFFERGCPDATSHAKMFKVMQSELMKWHTDKIKLLFRGGECGDADKMMLDMITTVVVKLMNAARDKMGN
jgi:hypothetical protein